MQHVSGKSDARIVILIFIFVQSGKIFTLSLYFKLMNYEKLGMYFVIPRATTQKKNMRRYS